jgi:hypothetical protein
VYVLAFPRPSATTRDGDLAAGNLLLTRQAGDQSSWPGNLARTRQSILSWKASYIILAPNYIAQNTQLFTRHSTARYKTIAIWDDVVNKQTMTSSS